ncbi:hypothetical protein BH09ACT11_BH09ACT11_04010 [soil metagenome]
MISFVWEPGLPLPAGTGGSENYTVGHVRELNRRGVAAQVVTVGVGRDDGRDGFRDIPFLALEELAEVSRLEGTVVFVSGFPVVPTVAPAYQILHIPPPTRTVEALAMAAQTRDRILIATSRFAAQMWARFLDVDEATINVVYPFAEPCFGLELRPGRPRRSARVLYAGRLSPEKGIYTFLAMMHSALLIDQVDADLTFTVTTAGDDKPQGRIIRGLLDAHPEVTVVEARRSPEAMATLMADYDVVVMPSNSQYWHETFGIVSIEAQHAGCRVVASDDGGLPETDCGGVVLVAPDDADALARGILAAIDRGPLLERDRRAASARFTVGQSVDELLAVFVRPQPLTPAAVVEVLETLVRLPPASELTRSPRASAASPAVRRPASRPENDQLMAEPSAGALP